MENVLSPLQAAISIKKEYEHILTDDALQFLGKLHEKFESERQALLLERSRKQDEIDQGKLPQFLSETEWIRNSNWEVADVPKDLQDRRVEITGPAGDPKMVINALNSGAKAFMADLEDANSPTWENSIGGQVNLYAAVRRTLTFSAANGKDYRLNDQTATLIVRPRGWHLEEKHLTYNSRPASASLVDFGLYFFHNAKTLVQNGSGPYFYLPKLESHLEARLWNNVFVFAQQELGIPVGTIKATVLIETVLASFEADEILYELKEHSAGLNCGRWDYIFSFIKKLRKHEQYCLPDRADVTMTVPFMRAYTQYVVKTCHRRNAHAIGGMAAQIPIKNDDAANQQALLKVKSDKEREANDGHDGSWVAHPGLVPVVLDVFNEIMPSPNQRFRQRNDVQVTASDLLQPLSGNITENGLRTNISVGIQYIGAWLDGKGAVPIFHLMEDAATAEISRAQVWQWIRHNEGVLEDGTKITLELVQKIVDEESIKLGESYDRAKDLFLLLVTDDNFCEFLTLPGYQKLTEGEK
ncbi:malate synthase A [Fictibacillus iocasae]|uniref:Malate synthase n=1 Tax=Fictibacillus iocasae TaxID=2715437 RepID=A0ABW2NM03_9BACL